MFEDRLTVSRAQCVAFGGDTSRERVPSVLTETAYLPTRCLWNQMFAATPDFWEWFRTWVLESTVRVTISPGGVGVATPTLGVAERAISEVARMLVEESQEAAQKGKVPARMATMWMHLLYIAGNGEAELFAVWQGLSADPTALAEAKTASGRRLRARAKSLISGIAKKGSVELEDLQVLLAWDRKVREQPPAAAA